MRLERFLYLIPEISSTAIAASFWYVILSQSVQLFVSYECIPLNPIACTTRISRKFACCRFIWIEKRDILLQIFDIHVVRRQDSIFSAFWFRLLLHIRRISCCIYFNGLKNPDHHIQFISNLFSEHLHPLTACICFGVVRWIIWLYVGIQLCFQLHGSLIQEY